MKIMYFGVQECAFWMLLKVVPLSFLARFLGFIQFCLGGFIRVFRLNTEIHSRYENICELVLWYFSCQVLQKSFQSITSTFVIFVAFTFYSIWNKKTYSSFDFLCFLCLVFPGSSHSSLKKEITNILSYNKSNHFHFCKVKRDVNPLLQLSKM